MCSETMERGNYAEGKEQFMMWSTPHHLSHMEEAVCTCMAASESTLVFLLFTQQMEEKQHVMCRGAERFTQMQPNAAKLTEQHITL